MSHKIVILHPHFILPGGAGKVVLEVGKRLVKRGYEVVVLCSHLDPDITDPYLPRKSFILYGGPLSSSPLFWVVFPFTFWRIKRIIESLGQVVIFPQVFPANWFGFWYKVWHPSVRLVWMCQEPSAFIHNPRWIAAIPHTLIRWIARLVRPLFGWVDITLARMSDAVMVNSHFSLQETQNVYHFPPHYIKPVYLGVDHSIRINTRKKDPHRLITISRLSKFKNVADIINTVPLLQARGFRDITLTIVGDGEELQRLKEHVRSHHIEGVDFVGKVDDATVHHLLTVAGVYVAAAIGEPFGLSVVEAMSHGLPVVAPRSGGFCETVTHAEDGVLVEGHTPIALADGISHVISDISTYTRFASRARISAQRFDWERTTDEFLQVLFPHEK